MSANPLTDETSTTEDAGLLALAKTGNRDALEGLIARHQPWIYNIVLRMVYDPHDAEDITQEILIKLITKLSTFDPLVEKRIDGLDALKAHVAPFAGKISIERSEMINPVVRREGDVAVLTFNVIDHSSKIGDGPKGDSRWKIIHSHWSFVQPKTS